MERLTPRPSRSRTFPEIQVDPDLAQILRYLGYPPGVGPAPEVARCVEEAAELARGGLRPRGTWALYDVEAQGKSTLRLRGGVTFRGAIGDYLAAATRAAVFLATAGEEVVARASEAFRAGKSLRGLVLGALGSQLAEGAVEALMADLRGELRPGEALTLRYSPGYCGMHLSQQRLIFELVDARAVGVELLPSLMMRPVKSVSGLVGLGDAKAVHAYGSPCDRCPLTDCKMRR